MTSVIPYRCPNCEIGRVVKKVCKNCGNQFGHVKMEKGKKQVGFPRFSRKERDYLNKDEELKRCLKNK